MKKSPHSDLQGITRIIADATIGITDLVEAMHKRIVHPPFLPSTPIQHLITNIASITYQNIRWTTQFIGNGLDQTLEKLAPVLGESEMTDEKEAIRAALNGVVGDYLAETENPLQIKMQIRSEGKAIPLDPKSLKQTYPTANGKILLMIHGSCMNDLQWNRKGHNHGEALAQEFGKTPVYLHYNTGRHISTNGQDFNEVVEKLLLNWPVPVEELVILAHSMGGLVTRSALHYAQQQQKTWPQYLQKIFFLGTPHHGAPLERAGNYVDVLLEAVPYAKPFARLGKIRSAGITDLRYSNLVDEDWRGNDRFEMQADRRQMVPLPENIGYYSIAAVLGKTKNYVSGQLVGDGLVGLDSALGKHRDPAKALTFKKENTLITYENSHFDLLSDVGVYEKLRGWFGEIQSQ